MWENDRGIKFFHVCYTSFYPSISSVFIHFYFFRLGSCTRTRHNRVITHTHTYTRTGIHFLSISEKMAKKTKRIHKNNRFMVYGGLCELMHIILHKFKIFSQITQIITAYSTQRAHTHKTVTGRDDCEKWRKTTTTNLQETNLLRSFASHIFTDIEIVSNGLERNAVYLLVVAVNVRTFEKRKNRKIERNGWMREDMHKSVWI